MICPNSVLRKPVRMEGPPVPVHSWQVSLGALCAPESPDAGEGAAHRQLHPRSALLQPACAWTTCWWLRTGLCSSDHPLPMVHTGHSRGQRTRAACQGGKENQTVVALLGSYNSLFLAPEVSEEKLVTEKVSESPLAPSAPFAQLVTVPDGPNAAPTSRVGDVHCSPLRMPWDPGRTHSYP